jgi:hypothetical protein
MNTTDNIILINAVLGTAVVPPIVQFLKSSHWSSSLKRTLAFVLCVLIAGGEYIAVGNHFESFAISAPILFGMATAAYTLFFKGTLGSLESMTPLDGLVNVVDAPKSGPPAGDIPK